MQRSQIACYPQFSLPSSTFPLMMQKFYQLLTQNNSTLIANGSHLEPPVHRPLRSCSALHESLSRSAIHDSAQELGALEGVWFEEKTKV